MKRTLFFLLSMMVVSVTIVIASGSETASADGGSREAMLKQYGVASHVSGVTVTRGLSFAGFKGDVATAVRQATGFNQTVGFTTTAYTPTYCWTRDHWRGGKSSLGNLLWKFHHTIDYCFRSGKLVGTPVSWSWGEVLAPFWQYKGEVSSKQYWLSASSYYSFRQGEFGLCIKWLGCPQHVYPWISWYAYGDGSAYYRQGG